MSIIDEHLQLNKSEYWKLYDFSQKCLNEFRATSDEDCWYSIKIKNRLFDINIYSDEWNETEYMNCLVYECFHCLDGSEEGYWSTSTDKSRHLWELHNER